MGGKELKQINRPMNVGTSNGGKSVKWSYFYLRKTDVVSLARQHQEEYNGF
jgi:hypothetical protein